MIERFPFGPASTARMPRFWAWGDAIERYQMIYKIRGLHTKLGRWWARLRHFDAAVYSMKDLTNGFFRPGSKSGPGSGEDAQQVYFSVWGSSS